MQITKNIELDYGHTLPNHYSFCNQIHGHRAKIQATIEGEIVTDANSSSQGMVMDFSILKEIMMTYVHGALDHGFAVWKDDTVDKIFITNRNTKYLITDEPPTAEYLAKWAYNTICRFLPSDIRLISVRWFETPNSWADYSWDDVINETKVCNSSKS